MKKIIIAGSKGLIGSVVTSHFKKNHKVIELDLQLGHDLCNEQFVKEFFTNNKADYLINLFALNHHVEKDGTTSNRILDISLDSFRKYLEVNLTALFSVCREYARNNERGSIINFSSTYGLGSPRKELYDGNEKHIAYGVSKAGVVQLTKHLATHLAPHIRVNCVVPGGVKHNQSEKFQKDYAAHTPLGRMMEPHELLGILDYLCSEKSSYSTGSVFVVDGGWGCY